MNKPKATWRVVVSVLMAVLFYATNSAYGVFRTSFEASMAVKQVEDSVVTYSLVQQMLSTNVVSSTLLIVFVVTMLLVWGSYAMKAFRKQNSDNS